MLNEYENKIKDHNKYKKKILYLKQVGGVVHDYFHKQACASVQIHLAQV